MEKSSTEERILDAATKEFALHGFDGARIDRIARKGKINKAMIYYHYKGKEALYEAILSNMYETILRALAQTVPEEKDPEEQLTILIGFFIDFIKDLDQDFVRIMLRELSSGGKYFQKLAIPHLIVPVAGIIMKIFQNGKGSGAFRDVHPHFTWLQTMGSIVFFNAIRLVIENTEFGKFIFSGDYFEDFKINLISIMKRGILADGKEK